MKICVFGLWHLGSVTAGCLCKLGFEVSGLDSDENRVANLNEGKAPLYEPGLDDLIKAGLDSGRLCFSTDASAALGDADVLWIAFDTPVDEDDVADVDFVEKNIRPASPLLKDGAVVIISSQVPVGFTRRMREESEREPTEKKLHFGYSPENLRLGKAIERFLEPDRIVVGTLPEEKDLFSPVFSAISDRVEWMCIESAEMTKHAINAFLATSICFANEIAVICEQVGADAQEVERGLKTEERIGPRAYVGPGAAFSGGTLARDVMSLSEIGGEYGLQLHLIKSVKASNDFHKGWVKRKCVELLGYLEGKKAAVLGLTYRPDTDTLRRSLSVELCGWLHENGVCVKAYDPGVKELPDELGGIISLGESVKAIVSDADCVIVATEWREFRELDGETIEGMSGKIVIDPNGFLEQQLGSVSNINYVVVGRR